jgi:hypothetical protein
MFLLDTNVSSELRKGDRGDGRIAAWYAGTREADLFISVLVAGEIRGGVERLFRRDPRQAETLERWLQRWYLCTRTGHSRGRDHLGSRSRSTPLERAEPPHANRSSAPCCSYRDAFHDP